LSFSPLVNQLINALRSLPGVGVKTAQRMAFHLLQRNREAGLSLAQALQQAIQQVDHCTQCRNLSETPICPLCANTNRNTQVLCIVESPIDVLAIEQSCAFSGYYFILMGHLSPIDGIGPQDIGIPQLKQRLENSAFQEVIIATNPTVEGEATAHYLTEMIRNYAMKVSRIAHGVPVGGELEYIDSGTVAHAISHRELLTS
jgi:recombination protein RecR